MKSSHVSFIVLISLFSKGLALINGQIGTAPWHANVFYQNSVGAGFYGGGSLISNWHVLTAGHMIHNFNMWNIGLGSSNRNFLIYMRTTHHLLHPNYNLNSLRDTDIGLLMLPQSIVFTVHIRPIDLPNLNVYAPFENEEGAIYGFGQTSAQVAESSDLLQQSFLRVIPDSRCYSTFSITLPNHFCAEDTLRLSNICNGDLGGGFVVNIYGRETLVGISSINLQACSGDEPSAYTRVSPFREWIRYATGV